MGNSITSSTANPATTLSVLSKVRSATLYVMRKTGGAQRPDEELPDAQ